MSQSCNLPTEIFFDIGGYLNRPQLIDCGLVCKAWYAAFGPQVWSHLELGSNKPITQFAADELCTKASWARSLVLEDPESTIEYSALCKKCTNLRSLAITATPDNEKVEYWNVCKDLVKRNRGTLKSLSLTDMWFPESKSKYRRSNWSPLLSIAQYPHSNLRTLRLKNCKLPYRHLCAFWDICESLEVLDLKHVPFELPQLQKIRRAVAGTGRHQSRPNLGSKHQDRIVRFSNLLELTLHESGPMNSLTALEEIIRQAPKLKSLDWSTYHGSWFPISRFMYLFSGQAKYHYPPSSAAIKLCVPLAPWVSPCWPNLESLSMARRYSTYFDPRDFSLVAETCKRICVLELPMRSLDSTVVDTLLRLHSNTLTVINWGGVYCEQSFSWVQQVLSSCPNLKKASFRPIHAQDLIEMEDTWVCCDSLEELRVPINMDLREGNPPRPKGTDQEMQEMSRAVFTRLGRLHRLKRLHLINYSIRISLQFNMGMGLGLLSDLTEFEELQYRSCQNMTPQDVDWMIKHWRSLKIIDGRGRLAPNRSRFVERMNPWDCALAARLNRHGVETPGCVYPVNYLEGIEVDWEYSWTASIPSDYQIEAEPYAVMDLDFLSQPQ
ncbi:hypothetical protein BGX27_007600 [Mortierella sp. AM989]|nr:hypothetical protein BGX27_007600 [Mortierella sp. AM989]